MLDGAIIGGIIGGSVGLIVAIVMMVVMKLKGGKVPRFSQFVHYAGNFEDMSARIEELLAAKGFFLHPYKYENGVFKNGIGALTAKKYIKITRQEGGYTIEAFIDVYGTESGLEGFTGALPKQTCKNVVNQIIALIQNG